jgi:hypothetical protein
MVIYAFQRSFGRGTHDNMSLLLPLLQPERAERKALTRGGGGGTFPSTRSADMFSWRVN